MSTKAELQARVDELEAAAAAKPVPAPKRPRQVWYRSTVDGNRGYMVEEGGKKFIELDRPNEVVRQPYNPKHWMVDKDERPLNSSQMAQIPFAADSALRRVLGRHDKHEGNWANLSDQQRIKWIEEGPSGGRRRVLFEAVMGAIADLGE